MTCPGQRRCQYSIEAAACLALALTGYANDSDDPGKEKVPRHTKGHPRPRRHPSPFAALEVPLSPEMVRVSGLRNCLPMLRRVVGLPGMPERSAAAEYFGIPRTTLRAALYKVESVVGFDLLVPWRQPLRATAKGRELIDEARHLLQLLDTAPSTPA